MNLMLTDISQRIHNKTRGQPLGETVALLLYVENGNRLSAPTRPPVCCAICQAYGRSQLYFM